MSSILDTGRDGCLSFAASAGVFLSLGALVLGTTLFLATSQAGLPREELGRRPIGDGLFGWTLRYFTEGVGVIGYDSSQGALSPPLRFLVHVGTILSACGVWLKLLPPARYNIESKCHLSVPMESIECVVETIMIYLLVMYIIHHAMSGVSDPGGPREHKIRRQPKWDDNTTRLSDADWKKWRCSVASESHDVTAARFKSVSHSLTGEAAGRQIWTSQTKSRPSGTAPVDEKLVQEMAAGGREPQKFNPSVNPNSCDMIFRAQQIREYIASGNEPPSMESKPKTVKETIRKAAHFYSMLQTEDGHWAADYGGPHFLMPGVIVAWYIMGRPSALLNDEQVELMKHYILVHQQSNGGWGTHIESPTTMFGSVLMYVSLRLLGTPPDHPASTKGREYIQDNGGALMTSSWSKLYLCMLGCMEWDGHNSVPPEMWMLPNWFPFHPGRMWCHARMVYLPMGYLYGSRFIFSGAETDATVQALRKEIYCQDYDSIPWIKTRHFIAPTDNYSPIPWVMKTLQNILARYETWSVFQPFKKFVRDKGLAFSIEYMHAEDLQTNYIDIGPVNKVLNMLSAFHAANGDLDDPAVVKHMMRMPDYLWVAEDGMKMQGYNGSQSWDTSFAIQALYEAEMLDEFPEMSRKAWNYLERTQILSTKVSQSSPAYQFEGSLYRNKYYRHISEGGWPFSTSAHGWPISDCTSEGLKATICLLKSKTIHNDLKCSSLNPIREERLQKAVNVLLSYQNEDGGWATYENNRGFGWYEQLNPSEVFGDIMIDYSYVECSMAVLVSLVDFHEMYPDHRVRDIQEAIRRGSNFIQSIQRTNGSWYGSWACCFCYGIWFGVEGLIKCGVPESSPSIKKACEFLLEHQRPNGGWGEDFTSCYDKDYAEEGMKAYGDDGSGVVNTAWALLSLSMAKCDDVEAVKRGVQYLMKRQLPSGDWAQEGISGVFNRSVGITYTAYRNVFPIWALGRCAATYGDKLDM